MTATGERPPAPVDDLARDQPHHIPAEMCVLGGMLMSKDAINDVLETRLLPRDFYRGGHEHVYNAIVEMYEDGESVDAITVGEHLQQTGRIGLMGGLPYLHTLMAAVPTAANAGYYARIVRSRGILRQLIEVGTRAVQMGYSEDVDDPEDLVLRARSHFDDILNARYTAAGIELMPPLMQRVLEALGKPLPKNDALPTGFADLDAVLGGGVKPGQMIVIAARPALGKSTLALDIARNLSIKHGIPGLFHTLEMTTEEIIYGAISAEAGVFFHQVRLHDLSETEDWPRILRAYPRMADAPLYLDPTPVISMSGIRRRFNELARDPKTRPRYIIIDYLQLVTTPEGGRRSESREREVSEMSRAAKLLAKELHVPVIMLAQLNRGPEQRADKKPVLSDLRESGSIEQDADIVILLHREDAYEKEGPRAGEADFIVAKNRNGPTTIVTVAFQGHYHRFVDMAA